MARFTVPDTLPFPNAQTLELADLETDLKKKEDRTQGRLINWGYAICEASVRTWFDTSLPSPTNFPYPAVGV